MSNPCSRWRHVRRLFGIGRRRLWRNTSHRQSESQLPVDCAENANGFESCTPQRQRRWPCLCFNLRYQNGPCTRVCPEGILLKSWASTMIISSRWKPSAWGMGQRNAGNSGWRRFPSRAQSLSKPACGTRR
jgi:hypothetical protein